MSLSPRQWNHLLEALDNGSCVVLLGPSISTTDDTGVPLNDQFAQQICQELASEKIAYDKTHKSNLTYIMQRYTTIPNVAPSDPSFEAKNFYKTYKGKYNEVQKAIAELPVNLIINTSPDEAMVSALKQAGKFETIHAWYDYRKELKQELHTPTKDAPLVYNLFGYYENAMSLVLTETDQVEYMKNVIKDQPPLPPKLLGMLDSRKTYLFLGFDWEQWNLRLLLEGMNLGKDSNILAHSRTNKPLEAKTQDFYESSFRFSFIKDKVADFVAELKHKHMEHVGAEVAQKNMYIVAHSAEAEFLDNLSTSLKSLPLNIMHKGLVKPGEEVEKFIQKNLAEADLMLLLISADFLASDDLMEQEWPILLKRHQEDGTTVIPIITRACNWQDWQDGELTKMSLILPREGQQFKIFSAWENPDDALNAITQEIQDLL